MFNKNLLNSQYLKKQMQKKIDETEKNKNKSLFKKRILKFSLFTIIPIVIIVPSIATPIIINNGKSMINPSIPNIYFQNNLINNINKISFEVKSMIGIDSNISATEKEKNYYSLTSLIPENKNILNLIYASFKFTDINNNFIDPLLIIDSIFVSSLKEVEINYLNKTANIPNIKILVNLKEDINITNFESKIIEINLMNLGSIKYDNSDILLSVNITEYFSLEKLNKYVIEKIDDINVQQKKIRYLNLPNSLPNDYDFKNLLNQMFSFKSSSSLVLLDAISGIEVITYSLSELKVPPIKINILTTYKINNNDINKLSFTLDNLGYF